MSQKLLLKKTYAIIIMFKINGPLLFMNNHLLRIHSQSYKYDIMHKKNILQDIFFLQEYACIIFDQAIEELMPKNIHSVVLISIKAIESNKNFKTLAYIWDQFSKNKVNRKKKILIVGGGIIHDVAVLGTSLYHRGIDFDYIPTTLLSMVDVCVGGKCAINYKNFKNIIGCIRPARTVYIDEFFLKSLSTKHIVAGLAEAVKTTFVYNDESLNTYFSLFTNIDLLSNTAENLLNFIPIISLSLKTKQKIVEMDEHDLNVRQFLNFGHTFAHAIESATSNKIEHGVAVALGILCIVLYQEMTGITINKNTHKVVLHIVNDLLPPIIHDLNFKKQLENMKWYSFWKALTLDKKNLTDFITFVVPRTQTQSLSKKNIHNIYNVELYPTPINNELKKTVLKIFKILTTNNFLKEIKK